MALTAGTRDGRVLSWMQGWPECWADCRYQGWPNIRMTADIYDVMAVHSNSEKWPIYMVRSLIYHSLVYYNCYSIARYAFTWQWHMPDIMPWDTTVLEYEVILPWNVILHISLDSGSLGFTDWSVCALQRRGGREGGVLHQIFCRWVQHMVDPNGSKVL